MVLAEAEDRGIELGSGADLLGDLVDEDDLVEEPGSIAVAAKACSIVAPLRSACCTTTIRPSVGVFDTSSSSSTGRVSSPQWNEDPRFSSDRRAFCRAVV